MVSKKKGVKEMLTIPVVSRVVGEGVGVEETYRLAPDRALGDERELAGCVGVGLAVPFPSTDEPPRTGGARVACHSPL